MLIAEILIPVLLITLETVVLAVWHLQMLARCTFICSSDDVELCIHCPSDMAVDIANTVPAKPITLLGWLLAYPVCILYLAR